MKNKETNDNKGKRKRTKGILRKHKQTNEHQGKPMQNKSSQEKQGNQCEPN